MVGCRCNNGVDPRKIERVTSLRRLAINRDFSRSFLRHFNNASVQRRELVPTQPIGRFAIASMVRRPQRQTEKNSVRAYVSALVELECVTEAG
jgi:hypothetical protein